MKAWNISTKKVKFSIAWDYGFTVSLFKYFWTEEKLKLLKVSKVYTVATLLQNFLIALYGCQNINLKNQKSITNTLRFLHLTKDCLINVWKSNKYKFFQPKEYLTNVFESNKYTLSKH